MPRKPKTELQKEIGARLRVIREIKGLSQNAIAEIAGVGATTINGWESGRNQIDVVALAWIASHLGVSTDYILLNDIGSLRFDTAVQVQAATRSQMAAGPRPRGRPTGTPKVRDIPEPGLRPARTTLHETASSYTPPPDTHRK